MSQVLRLLVTAALVHLATAPGALALDRVGVPEASGPLRVERGRPLERAVPLPPARAVDGVAGDGWYLVVLFDGTAPDGAPRPRLELGGERVELEALAHPEGGRVRYVGRLGPERTAELGESLALELSVRGAALTVTDLELERHHAVPTTALLGKANGHLGPDRLDAGALGFVALTEHLARAFAVIEVRPGSPSERAGLEPGDLVLAVDGAPLAASSIAPGWDWFERSHEATLGRALEAAAREGRREVELTVLRDGDLESLDLEHPYRPRAFGIGGGDLSAALDAGFPLEGPLGDALVGDLVGWAVRNQRPNGSWPGTDAVNPALGALGLLGTGDPAHRERVGRAVDFLLERNPSPSAMTGLAYWTIAFQGVLLCEWHLATGDERALAWVEEAVRWLPTTTHVSAWGMPAFGHGPDGLPYEEKGLIAPAAHLFVLDALARRCGVESRVYEAVAEYVRHAWSDPSAGGHGGMGYNHAARDREEFWSRSGLVALAEHLRGDDETGMRGPLVAFMEERHPWMLNSHAYGEPGGALGLLALATVDRAVFERVVAQWRWRFLLAWEPGYGLRYSTPHMGAPYMGDESVLNLGYLLLASARTRTLALAGAAGE